MRGTLCFTSLQRNDRVTCIITQYTAIFASCLDPCFVSVSTGPRSTDDQSLLRCYGMLWLL